MSNNSNKTNVTHNRLSKNKIVQNLQETFLNNAYNYQQQKDNHLHASTYIFSAAIRKGQKEAIQLPGYCEFRT